MHIKTSGPQLDMKWTNSCFQKTKHTAPSIITGIIGLYRHHSSIHAYIPAHIRTLIMTSSFPLLGRRPQSLGAAHQARRNHGRPPKIAHGEHTEPPVHLLVHAHVVRQPRPQLELPLNPPQHLLRRRKELDVAQANCRCRLSAIVSS